MANENVEITDLIIEDLKKLETHELGKVYRYIRTNLIANLPNSQKIKEPNLECWNARSCNLFDECLIKNKDLRCYKNRPCFI